MYKPLKKEDVVSAVDGTWVIRPPVYMHKWAGEGLNDYHGEDAVREIFNRYPDDIVEGNIRQPGGLSAPEGFSPDYCWAWPGHPRRDARDNEKRGKDSGSVVLESFDHLDEFLANFPEADDPAIYDAVRKAAERAGGRYVAAKAFNNFYERLWSLRGMQNLLMDFHIHKKELHRLCDALLGIVLEFVNGAADAGADAFVTSNDLGHQTGLMMSPASFREFLKPLHVKVAEACHSRGMHYWMHSCGNLTDILSDLIEAGVDCLHPLQYGAMDWQSTAAIIRGKMTAWAGVDVQHILQEETPKGVRVHVRELIDTFNRPGEGGCVVAAGNGITGSTPLENIDAFLDETFCYGLKCSAAEDA